MTSLYLRNEIICSKAQKKELNYKIIHYVFEEPNSKNKIEEFKKYLNQTLKIPENFNILKQIKILSKNTFSEDQIKNYILSIFSTDIFLLYTDSIIESDLFINETNICAILIGSNNGYICKKYDHFFIKFISSNVHCGGFLLDYVENYLKFNTNFKVMCLDALPSAFGFYKKKGFFYSLQNFDIFYHNIRMIKILQNKELVELKKDYEKENWSTEFKFGNNPFLGIFPFFKTLFIN